MTYDEVKVALAAAAMRCAERESGGWEAFLAAFENYRQEMLNQFALSPAANLANAQGRVQNCTALSDIFVNRKHVVETANKLKDANYGSRTPSA